MAFIFAIIVLLFVFIANTNREKKVEDSITEIKKKWNIEAEEKKEKEEYIVNKIVRDRICKYFNDIYFVLNEKTFLQLIWSENGDTLYHIISEFNNYQNIEIEENIEKSYIEYIKINDIRYLLENLYDIIIPDIKQLNENIEQTQRSINIAKNLENGTQYIQLMKKYLITMEKLLAGVDNGLYVTNVWYTRFQSYYTGVFSTIPRDGIFVIKNGSIVGSVNNIRITENLMDMLKNISNISNRTECVQWWEEISPPVYTPYVLIKDVNVTLPTM